MSYKKKYVVVDSDNLTKIATMDSKIGGFTNGDELLNYENNREIIEEANINHKSGPTDNRKDYFQVQGNPAGYGRGYTNCYYFDHRNPENLTKVCDGCDPVTGLHYDIDPEDGIARPTIWAGMKFIIHRPNKPTEKEEEKPIEDRPKDNKPIGSDDNWDGITHQAPDPILEIFIPSKYDPQNPDFTYSAKPGTLNNLLGYTFTEAVDDLFGSFSFTIENEELEDEKATFDVIPLRSIVKIYEGDKDRPVFVGIIRSRKLGLAMVQNAKRTIIFSGKSLASCITEYMISLDMRIINVMDAENKNMELLELLMQDDLSIKDFIKITWQHFNSVAAEINKNTNGVTNTIVKDIITKFMSDGKEIPYSPKKKDILIPDIGKFVTVEGNETSFHYNISCSFYNQSTNIISDMWKNLLPEKVYELYAYCSRRDGKQKIMVRQVPFGDMYENDDWKNLDIYLIRPIVLTSYTLEQKDEEMYTVFISYLIGSAMDRQFYMAVMQGDDDTVMRNKEKVNIYGFKPLQLDFVGYNRQGNTNEKENEILKKRFKMLNEKAAYWYSRLDEMYSGNITIINDFTWKERGKQNPNPRVGCRARFMGGDFYITRTEHSWQYGGTPYINLTLSRGMVYDSTNGQMKNGDKGIIKNIGRRYRELEKENV